MRCATRPTSRSVTRGCKRRGPSRRSRRCSACGSMGRSRTRRCSASAGPTRRRSDYRAALAPWLALRDRSMLDSAVQESLLAVPYAFAQLGADKQAADHYVDAIDAFNSEIVRLTSSIDSIENGELITRAARRARGRRERSIGLVLAPRADSGLGRKPLSLRALGEQSLPRRAQELPRPAPGKPQSRPLGREPRRVRRHSRYAPARVRAAAAEHRRELVERRPAGHDGAARRARVAIAGDRAQRGRRRARHGEGAGDVGRCSRRWSRSSRCCRTMRPATKYARSIGSCAVCLLWDLQRDYKARLWAERKSLAELDRQLREAQRRHHQVSSARDDWPEKFASSDGAHRGLAAPRARACRAQRRRR